FQQSQLQSISKPVQLTIEEQSWLKTHQPIRIAFDADFPPYSFLNDSGQLAGVAYDTIQLISQKLNIQFETSPRVNWQKIYKAALAKKIDVVATMVDRPGRANQFTFTAPYIFKSLVIITHKSNEQIKTRNDLFGKKIALVKNYLYSQGLLNSLQQITPIYVDTIEDALLAVETQQVDATISFFAASSFLQNKHHFNNIKFTAFYDRNSANESIAVRKDWPILTGILQKGLNAITESEKQAINMLWNSPTEIPSSYDLASFAAVICLLIIFGLLIWVSQSQRHSRYRKLASQKLLHSNDTLNESIEELENQVVQHTKQLHDSEQKYLALLDQLADEFFFYQLNLKAEYTYLSQSITNILGYSVSQFSLYHYTYQTGHPGNAKIDEYTRLCLSGENVPSYRIEMFDSKGAKHFLKVIQKPLLDINGQCIGLEGTAQDITLQEQTRDKLNKLENYDALTGLANRHLFTEHITQLITSKHLEGEPFSVLFLDLDGFKLVNDHFGHSTGDKVLKEVAIKLKTQLNSKEIAARIGGDEFALVLLATDANTAIVVAENILRSLLTPFVLNEHQFVLGGSIGIAIYPQDGTDSETLLHKADSAMYIAKNNNIAYALYTPLPDRKISRKQVLEKSLREILSQNDFALPTELSLVYHSIHNISDKHILAYESLLHWQHPELGLISATELIALAIETGLAAELSRWVINQACLQAKRWTEEEFDFGRICINISTIELVNFELSEIIIEQITASNANPEWFEIEISESASITMPDITRQTIQKLLDAGIRTSLDKFGVGSSSLANLKNLPISDIKIDPSLIHHILSSPEDQATVHALISLTHALEKRVIAVGVETLGQLEFLAESHCDMAQGYYFSKPVPAEEITNYISQIYN
ncbi:MAG: diguanylate cyclase, partial [Gammaproteobacteria bacterium]